MAKKRSDSLTEKISSKTPQERAGWQDQFQNAPPEPPQPQEKYKRQTYLLTPQLIERVKAQAHRHDLQLNDFVRGILDIILTQIENGELELEISEDVQVQRRLK